MTIGRIPSVEGGIQPTIVDAKGDILTATAADTPAVLAVGSNGDTLVADSSTATGLRYNPSTSGGRNFAINGGFDFWQRGTSFSTNGSYTADRWFASWGGTASISQETSVVLSGSTYAAKVTHSASGSFGELYNALESLDVNFLAGKTVTLSAYVRANATYTGQAQIQLQTNTTANTQGGGTWSGLANTEITPSTSAYTRISLTTTVPAGTAGLRIRLGNTATQANGSILYWANVQLEIGSVATTFSRAGGTLAGELAACQRYYAKTYNQGVTPGTATANGAIVGFQLSTTQANTPFVNWNLPVEMRTTPTLTGYSKNSGASGKMSGGSTDYNFATNSAVNGTGRVCAYPAGTIPAIVDCYFQITAEAEL